MKLPSTPTQHRVRPSVLAASLLALPLSLGLSGCFFDGQADLQLPGYIEADTTSVASPVSGTMAQLSVKEGQIVKPGDMLYTLESQQEQARLAEAQARKQQAEAQSKNLSKGARQAELESLRAKLRYAQAQLSQAESNLKKSESLLKKNFVSETQVDNDRTNVQLAEAQVEDARAALRVAKEGARTDEQAAAQAQTVAAQAGVAQVEWLLQQKQVTAPVAGVIQELYVRQGEFATAGSTTMTILHTGSLRVRFFVPNDLRPKFLPGNQVAVEISGCDKPAIARVTRVSARPEYTQPMMFSQELRDRLSFLTEARLETPAGCTAPPGTPVGVKVAGVAAKAS
ncbi:HlyD family secretion protein [Aquabacterium parvum]|uniref:HlyD family secretion protein n=1 Tax=Aquabacterium parvum TaxID=70584 RepID=UPI000718B911|nr:HlyD family secretion protein [Aquabacterium parvum]MBU0914836.1 HlyD family efflux transporter periplasmic adaptor subunit [Gammaproteobacteria bacterium]